MVTQGQPSLRTFLGQLLSVLTGSAGVNGRRDEGRREGQSENGRRRRCDVEEEAEAGEL